MKQNYGNKLYNNLIKKRDYSLEAILNYEYSTFMTHKKLIRKTFEQLNSTIRKIENNTYSFNLILDYVDFLCALCDLEKFSAEEVLVNRKRIKKSREAILAYANKFDSDILRECANKLDQIVLDKNFKVDDLILFIKKLIDKKEDIEIIKRLLSSNKGAILLDENELFDYTFNIAIDSYNKNSSDIYYYITLLKILYSTKIDKDKYTNELNKLDKDDLLLKEIYMIILGNRRSLSPEEILHKYEIKKDLPHSNIYIPNNSDNDDYVFTIDERSTRVKDDGLSIRKDGNKLIVGIHIVDVGGAIVPNSPVDLQAYNNYKCAYLPNSSSRIYNGNIEKNLSLNVGQFRKVLTLYVVFNSCYDIVDYYYKENIIRVAQKLSYEQTDKVLDGITKIDISREIFDLYSIACILEQRNKKKKEYVEKRRKQKNKDAKEQKASDKLVSEFMNVYNYIVPTIMCENNAFYVYRTQGPAYFKELAKKLNISLDEETLRFLNSLFLSSKYTSYPLYHNGINVPIYSHSSSPCIRYVDTYNQFLAHAFYFKDLKYDIDYDEHLRNIDYFNQRDVEISLMQAEYVRSFKIQNKS